MSDARKQLSRIIIVAKKELVDFVRDWRTVLAMILVPLLIFPAIFIALPLFLQGEAAELSSYELTVEVQGELPEDLSSHLDGRNLIIIQTELLVDGTLSEPGDDAGRLNTDVSGEVIHAILRLREIDSNASQSWNYAILSDSTDELSLEAKIRTLDAVLTWEADVINATLADNNLTHDEAFDPIHWDGDQDVADVASGGDLAAMGLAMFIPLVVAMWTTTAAIQPSIDLTAGEREGDDGSPALHAHCSLIPTLREMVGSRHCCLRQCARTDGGAVVRNQFPNGRGVRGAQYLDNWCVVAFAQCYFVRHLRGCHRIGSRRSCPQCS